MKYVFSSILKDVIFGFLKEKRSLGFNYEAEERHLRDIDKLALSVDLKEVVITKGFVESYIAKRTYEKPINRTHRVRVIRELAKYMIRMGYDAYIVPPLPKNSYRSDFVPYIFTEDEIKRIFTAIDEWSTSKSLDCQYYPQRYKYTVIFRILYSTGMRISEVLNLKLENINFENNTFIILNAKNHSERIIPIHVNMMNILKTYIIHENIFVSDDYLFKGKNKNRHLDKSTVDFFFLKFLRLAGIPHPKDGPRVHSFRHTFCVHRLKIWVLDKKDITALFPYLCAYMGHKDTRCTEYYLRLTADLYPDIIYKTEAYLYGGDQDVK